MATPKYFGLAEIKVSRNLNCHSKQTYCGNTSPNISLDFIYSINMINDPLTKLLSWEVFGNDVKSTVDEYLNDHFGQVGDVRIMCPATIFKIT
jgi:hypothetical protein